MDDEIQVTNKCISFITDEQDSTNMSAIQVFVLYLDVFTQSDASTCHTLHKQRDSWQNESLSELPEMT